MEHVPDIGRRNAEKGILGNFWIDGIVALGIYFSIFLETDTKVGGSHLFHSFGTCGPVTTSKNGLFLSAVSSVYAACISFVAFPRNFSDVQLYIFYILHSINYSIKKAMNV